MWLMYSMEGKQRKNTEKQTNKQTKSDRSFSVKCLLAIHCGGQRFPTGTHLCQPLIKSPK